MDDDLNEKKDYKKQFCPISFSFHCEVRDTDGEV